MEVDDIGKYGCNIKPVPIHSVAFNIFLITFITFFVWDWIVLGLYLYKIYQLQHHKVHNEFKQNVNERIMKY